MTLESLESRELLSVSPLSGLETAVSYQPSYLDAPTIENQWIVKINQDHQQQKGIDENLARKFEQAGINVLEDLGTPGLFLVEINASLNNQQYILEQFTCFEYYQPNQIFSDCGVTDLVNDPKAGDQWALDFIGVSDAWSVSDGSGVVIGILDSGISLDHPDLADQIWLNTAEIPNNGIDDDGNGFIDDLHGWNFFGDTSDVNDLDGHGTHVAGIIGAISDNNLQGTGVAPGVTVLPVKIIQGGEASTSTIVAGINYLIDLKVRGGVNIPVINASIGFYDTENIAVRDAVRAAGEAGILVVASAGNKGQDNDTSPHYPSDYTLQLDHVLSVASIDKNGNLASNSNYGLSTVDLAAPGVNIGSTTLNSGFGNLSGTSMATAFVSAAAALLASADPTLTPAQIKSKILESVEPLTTLDGKVATGGVLNLTRLFTLPAPPETPSKPDAVLSTPDSIRISWQPVAGADSYRVEVTDQLASSWRPLQTTADVFVVHSGVESGVTYRYRIVAVNEGGESSASEDVSISVPAAIRSLVGRALSDRQVELSWSPIVSATGYEILRSADGLDWRRVATTSASETEKTLSGHNPGTTYYFQVVARGTNGEATDIVEVTTRLTSPGIPRLKVLGSQSIQISWQATKNARGYRLERSSDGTTFETLESAAALSSGTKTFVDTTALPNSTYHYRVIALADDDATHSGTSRSKSATTAPAAPNGLQFSGLTDRQAVLSWESVPGATRYRIERFQDNRWISAGTTRELQWTARNLKPATDYRFRVVALGRTGNSDPSIALSLTTALAVPATPRQLRAYANDASEIGLTWQAVSGADSYVIKRFDPNDGNGTIVGTTSEAQWIDKDNLAASTRYTYEVYAQNSTGMSPRAAKSRISTLNASNGTILDTNLLIDDLTAKTAVLSWTSSIPGLSGRRTWRVQWSMDGIVWTSQRRISSTTNSVKLTGLKPETEYFLRLRLETGDDISSWSETISFRTSVYP